MFKFFIDLLLIKYFVDLNVLFEIVILRGLISLILYFCWILIDFWNDLVFDKVESIFILLNVMVIDIGFVLLSLVFWFYGFVFFEINCLISLILLVYVVVYKGVMFLVVFVLGLCKIVMIFFVVVVLFCIIRVINCFVKIVLWVLVVWRELVKKMEKIVIEIGLKSSFDIYIFRNF